mmetsp:Transcript_11070/g.26114  ORF Transcript_11070/g.26114 Transcript_11070/m.26114 type:complete len:322 (-) Transcript_11070:165-1130(-)
MQSHVSVLGTTGIVSSVGVDGKRIDGTKVSLDGSEFFFVDQPKESRLEFSDLSGGRRHGHGFLSTPQQDVFLRFGNDGVVDRSIRRVGLEVFQVDGVVELGGKVGRGCQEHGLVPVHLQAVDFLFVGHKLFLNVAGFRVVEADHSVVERHHDVLVEVGPRDVGHFDRLVLFLGNVDFENGRGALAVVRAVKDGDLGVVFHKGIRDGRKELVVVGPGDPTDRTPVGKVFEQLSGFAAPHLDRGIGARRQQVVGEPVGIEIPDGTLVPVIGPDALSVFDTPDAGDLILRGTEQQVSVVVVFYDSDGTLVSLQQIRAHLAILYI